MSFTNDNLGHGYIVIGTIGTVAATDRACIISNVLIPGTYVGTVKFHDSATAAGTTATSNIFTFGLPATSTPQLYNVGYTFKKGFTYEATGTPTLVVGID